MEKNENSKLSFLDDNKLEKLNMLLKNLKEYDSKFESQNIVYEYGNSGFRHNVENIKRLAFRVLVGTFLKSIENDGLPLGIMITACHHCYSDNGFKIAGINGEPISTEWMSFYSEIVNKPSLSEFIVNFISDLYQKKNLILDFNIQSSICFAIDTRPSSKSIFTIIKDSLMLLNSRFVYYEILTSPGLHFLTYLNQLGFMAHKHQKLPGKFTFFSANEYWNFLIRSNETLGQYADKLTFLKEKSKNDDNRYENNILIDCANGVAGFYVDKIKNIYAKEDLGSTFINTLYKNYSFLNGFCGSDFIIKEKNLPMNYPNYDKNDPRTLFTKNISLDGDVDRIVYFFKDHESIIDNQNSNDTKNNKVKIINGEHIKCVFSKLLDLLIENLSKDLKQKFCDSVKIVVFNTIYTNNAIKNYLSQLKNLKDFILIKQEVSELLAKAKEHDISIYYESSGKGAVFSNETTLKKIDKLYSFCYSSNDCLILEFLSVFLNSFNKTSGDALSSMIIFDKCLKILNLSLYDVYGLYKEYPYEFEYVELEKISNFKWDKDSSKITFPLELKNELDDYIKVTDEKAKCYFKMYNGQNSIRIYVESICKENIKNIIKKAKKLILDHCNN